MISRADLAESDPIIGQFLNFLAQDIEKNPQHLQALNSDLVNRVQALVADIELKLDALLADEDE